MQKRRIPTTAIAEQAQLEIWPEPVRGMSNDLARSGLFGVGNQNEPRLNMKRAPIPALMGLTITYTGEELRQDDLDVFMQIVHMARTQPLGTEVMFSAHAMLTQLGWTRNSGSYERLRACLERLKASALTVQTQDGSRGYSGSLIRSFKWQESDGHPMQRWQILLEREILILFPENGYTRLDWELRLSLPPMAKWLHAFYATHAAPYPISVDKLHRLTRSRVQALRQFRYKVRQSMDLLVERGFLTSARINPHDDLVYVERASRRQFIASE
jgi:hypothetical protein